MSSISQSDLTAQTHGFGVATHGRSMLTPLLRLCVATVGIALIFLAIGASLFSLMMGYRELSRRADCALMTLAGPIESARKAAAAVPPVVIQSFHFDPDILAVAISSPGQQPKLIFSKGEPSRLGTPLALSPTFGYPWFSGLFTVARRFGSASDPTSRTVFITYSTASAATRAFCQLLIFLLGAGLALGIAAAALKLVFGRRKVTMHDLAHATRSLAGGNYAVRIPCLDTPDEIGAIARAIETFKTKLLDREQMRQSSEIVHQTSIERHARIDIRVDTFRASIGKALAEVAGLSDQMTVAADSLASISTETNERASEAVQAIRQTSASVTTVAAASASLSASIREIEKQVEQTRGMVLAATRSTAETSSVIQGLFAKAEEIDEIIGLIQSIAAQTNLLSLNATIEAARAGESGRGFAVVAQEVKTLASQTARASQHVAGHVRSIQDATSQAVAAIDGIDATMAKAEQFSEIIAVAVEKQATATAEISRSASDAATAANSAAESMKRLAAAVGETDQSAAQVHQSAGDVGMQAQNLATTVDIFLRDTTALRMA